MAIIECTNCGRRISSFSTVCPHCDFAHGDISAEEREEIAIRRTKRQLYRAANLSYLALVFLVVGALWWWGAGPEGLVFPPPQGAIGLVGLGAVLYLVARSWIFWIRMNRK